jgi:TetR/AcrR family transcriptional repressor of nem operon
MTEAQPSKNDSSDPKHDSKTKLLDAALHVIREKGYAAATVDDICAAAKLTKGSFFHHFDSKEALALAAADHFAAMAGALFAAAPHHGSADPRQRLLGYVDLRAAMMHGELPDVTCLFGTMVQEVYETHPAIRKACDRHIRAHAATVAADISEAKRRFAPRARWSADSLALFTQAVVQGAFVLAKAHHDPGVGIECLSHLRRYLETLFEA